MMPAKSIDQISLPRDPSSAASRESALAYARMTRTEAAACRLAWLASLPERHPGMVLLAALSASAALAALAAPSVAPAFDWIGFDPIGWLLQLVADAACSLFSGAFGFIKGAADVDKILGDFSSLLGINGSGFATYAIRVANDVVKTCANTILAIVIMVQLIKIAGQFDKGGGTLPAVRDVFQLFVFMAVFAFLVNNAATLMTGIFELVQQIGRAIDATMDSQSLENIRVSITSGQIDSIPDALSWFILALISYVIALVASLVTRVMAYARALTIYLLTMFSPMAFAFLGMDVTRQWGIGYLKNFIAETLSGCVMVVVLWFYPVLLLSFVPDGTQLVLGAPEALEAAVDILVSSIVLCLLILRSGSTAQKILGGA